jgi:hypothetical protein
MADLNKHEEKAVNNQKFSKKISKDKTNFLDWCITSSFYSAVHYTEAIIFGSQTLTYKDAAKQIHKDLKHSDSFSQNGISTHKIRKEIIIQNQDVFGLQYYMDYKHLLEESHTARYKCHFHTKDEVDVCHTKLKSISKYYFKLKPNL